MDHQTERMGLGEGFALVGRRPSCGCPMAIDMDASPSAIADFESRGLLLEFMSPSAAMSAWEGGSWPCPHRGELPAPADSSPGRLSASEPPSLSLVRA